MGSSMNGANLQPDWGLLPVNLTNAEQRTALAADARAGGFMVVEVPPPSPAQRGAFGLGIEAAIEEALERRAALPPGVGASSDLDASLSDQLYRARLVGAAGLFLAFPSLEGISNLAGALDAEDSAVLRWWIAASHERPVRIAFDARDRFLAIYGEPVALSDLLSRRLPSEPPPAPRAAPEMAASVAAMELSDAPPDVVEDATAAEQPDSAELGEPDGEPSDEDELGAPNGEPGDEDALSAGAASDDATGDEPTHEALQAADELQEAEVTVEAPAEQANPEEDELQSQAGSPEDSNQADAVGDRVELEGERDEGTLLESSEHTPHDVIVSFWSQQLELGFERAAQRSVVRVQERSVEFEAAAQDDGEPHTVAQPVPECAARPSDDTDSSSQTDGALETVAEHAEPADHDAADDARDAEPADHDAADDARDAEPADEEPPAEILPLHPQAAELWRGWVRDLEHARGPKPLAVVERMFVSTYVPLSDAVACGVADEAAGDALETWSQSFAQSYSEAFHALCLRGKRPTMVLDVPDIALRIARLHGARSIQLILVDGMRFDLGLRMHEYLKLRVGPRAALTERLLLWSALPSTTAVQLDLIGAGPQGLTELATHAASEVPVARGRGAATLRRIKAGHRDVMKLDLVESRLSEPGGPVAARLDALADEVADVVAQHFTRLPARTLAMVFGDHGFALESFGDRSPVAQRGGASPEEVLVPAYAWLVGNVH